MSDKIEVEDLQRIKLEPGDTLFYQPDAALTQEQLDRLQLQFRDRFPDLRVVVFPPGKVFVGGPEE